MYRLLFANDFWHVLGSRSYVSGLLIDTRVVALLGLSRRSQCLVFRCCMSRAISWRVPAPLNAVEVVSPQPFCSNGPVVPLDIGILLRLAGLDVDQANPGVLSPCLEPTADIFGAIVHTNGQWLSTPNNNLAISRLFTASGNERARDFIHTTNATVRSRSTLVGCFSFSHFMDYIFSNV